MAPEICLGKINLKTGKPEFSLENLRLGQSIGSGFSGEVRRASLGEKQEVVTKILRPPPVKLAIRDRLWALAAGEPFPLEQTEQGVVYSLFCWQIFAEIANRTLNPDLGITVNPPSGFYYDFDRKAFALVSPYIDGTSGQPEVRTLEARGGAKDSYCAKMMAMSALAQLAKEIGMNDLARQFEKWTLVSPANVLQKENGQFVAVDVTPGLCVQIPLSPYDVRVLIEDIRKGDSGRRHFLTTDFSALEGYLKTHLDLADILPLVEELKALGCSPKPNSFAIVWEQRGWISRPEREALEREENWPFYFLLAKYLPILELSRKSNRDLLKVAWAEQQLESGKLTPEWAQAIAESDSKLLQYLLLKKPLEMGKTLVEKLFLTPARIIIGNRRFTRDWLKSINCPTIGLNRTKLEELKAENDIRDIAAIVALDLFFKVGSVSFLARLDVRLGFLAAFIELPFMFFPLPSPSGICRAAYLNMRSLIDLPEVARTQKGFLDKLRVTSGYVLERFGWSILISLKTVGNLVLPVKLYASHPQEATALARYLVSETVGKIPVFGEKSDFLQQLAFDLAFNLPHAAIDFFTKKFKQFKQGILKLPR